MKRCATFLKGDKWWRWRDLRLYSEPAKKKKKKPDQSTFKTWSTKRRRVSNFTILAVEMMFFLSLGQDWQQQQQTIWGYSCCLSVSRWKSFGTSSSETTVSVIELILIKNGGWKRGEGQPLEIEPKSQKRWISHSFVDYQKASKHHSPSVKCSCGCRSDVCACKCRDRVTEPHRKKHNNKKNSESCVDSGQCTLWVGNASKCSCIETSLKWLSKTNSSAFQK